jgi:hypothetical protein
MLPEHMPYFCGPRIHHKSNDDESCPHNPSITDDLLTPDTNAAALITAIITSRDVGSTSLLVHPVSFGTFTTPLIASTSASPSHQLYNAKFPLLAHSIARFKWAAYGFNSGHFMSTINKRNLPFNIVLACDPFAYGRALFHNIARCTEVLDGAGALLDHIWVSGQTYPINGYIIHSHRYQASTSSTAFWTLQALIVDNLFLLRKLRLFVAFVHLDHDGCSVTKFVWQLHDGGWIITRTECSFPDYGNSVMGLTSVVIGVHTSTQSKVEPLLFKTPPTCRLLTLASFIWPAFDKPD